MDGYPRCMEQVEGYERWAKVRKMGDVVRVIEWTKHQTGFEEK